MTSAPASQPAILLIDDSVSDLRVLIELLSLRKWRTTVAFDGLDGYRKAVLKQPDLILLDVRMPGMDGFATCRRLKADASTWQIPVIFLTAAEDKDDRLLGFALGAVDYVIKPYASEEEVLARIAIHLGLARRNAAPTDAGQESAPVRYSPLLQAAMNTLLENLADPPSTEVLARQLGTNEKRLNEIFRLAFALPVFGWLREQRLKQARRLLAETEMPIADIAVHCGYPLPANFATAFRERFDCTPRDFRRGVNRDALVVDGPPTTLET
jgi:DNA-binding response OmpR family regulator